MTVRVIGPDVIAKRNTDKRGGCDLLVDMNQVGLREDKIPPVEIHLEGERFHRAGIVEPTASNTAYWSYWNDGAPARNLQLCLS
jgi:hypothetical protein|tara:strand:- start:903 stop:1154 length:252 start_codon:yes stop_codon:yes gene_type:complete